MKAVAEIPSTLERELKVVEVEIRGITPLVQNTMPLEVLLGLRSKKKKPKSHIIDISPRDEAELKIHKDDKGNPVVTADMLMSSLVNAGRFVRLDGKKQMSTRSDTVVPGFISIDEPFFRIEPGEWEVDIRRGNNENAGKSVAICVCRPMFHKWAFKLVIRIDTESIHENQARELFDIALNRIGLGSMRPEKKGTFGRAVVTQWKVKES